MDRYVLRFVNWALHGVLVFLFFCIDWSVFEVGRFSIAGEGLVVFLSAMAYLGVVVSTSCAIYYLKAFSGGYVRVASRGPRSKPSEMFVG